MCTTCGCGDNGAVIEGQQPHEHGHHHHHHDHHHHDHHHGSLPESGESRRVRVEQDILALNNAHAANNRRFFAEKGILTLNLVSSPGSGKTSLLVRSIRDLGGRPVVSVIEGDQQTTNDAERIRETGVRAIQVNTGKGCHLDAHMIGHAVEELAPEAGSVLFIENVGNLVCPAAFDLGEAHKVVILSVTEGDDKPLKYPDMFHAADLMLLNKIDLLPYVEFDVEACIGHARRINPRLRVLQVSATTGAGMEGWYRWIRAARMLDLTGHPMGDDSA